MALSSEMAAVRGATALSRGDHVALVLVRGDGAFEVVDRLVPRKLFLRDGQAFQTILLSEDGAIFADAYVLRDDEDFYVFAEGPTSTALCAHVRACASAGTASFDVVDLSETHRLHSLHGPFAWELLAEIAGGRPVGVPYMTFFRGAGELCLRAGKTGEYGYDMLVRKDDEDAFVARCEELGAGFELHRVSLQTLDECALENCFFDIRREGTAQATLRELQLMWSISHKKEEYVGARSVREMKARPLARRATHVLCDEPFAQGDVVLHEDQEVGVVVNATTRLQGPFPGLALLDVSLAHPGIDALRVVTGQRERPLRTVCAPLCDNLSLKVNPQRHTFASRAELSAKR